MIQVDVFWSFAMGASLASAAADRLKASPSLLVNAPFLYTLLYLSLLFSPSGVYLLWEHTAWETMFWWGADEIHGMWPCLFALTNVLFGVAGFALTGALVRSGGPPGSEPGAGSAGGVGVQAMWTVPYTCMFAILSFGYDRFLYPGTLEEWRSGVKYPLVDFFSSQIFFTLLVMGLFVLPPLYNAVITWPAGPTMHAERRWALLGDAMTSYYRVTGLIVTGYFLLWRLTSALPIGWGVDRLFAFLIGQTIFGVLIFAPLLLIPVKSKEKIIKFRRD